MSEVNSENSLAPEVNEPTTDAVPRERGPRVFGRFAFWIVFVPFIYYLVSMMLGGYLEKMRIAFLKGDLDRPHYEEGNRLPVEEEVDISEKEKEHSGSRFLFGLLPLGRNSYPYTYTFNIAVTTFLVLLFGWGYFRAPFRISWLSFVVGAVGVVLWVGLTFLDERFVGLGNYLGSLFGGRSDYNPLEDLKYAPNWMWTFLGIRFFGLVLIVPLIEEFFVRGWLMRWVDDPDWDEVPLGQGTPKAWIAPTVYGVLTHPNEALAALVWFSLVSWVYKKTGSIWDCVVAHAVTNLLLGVYIVKSGAWQLW